MKSNKTYDPYMNVWDYEPDFKKVPWLNAPQIDFNMLKNKP